LINNRRKFLAKSAQGAGLATLGGLLWAGYSNTAKNHPLTLRPPSALDEQDFLSACIKCGLCAQACKTRDTNMAKDGSFRKPTIKMAKAGDNVLLGTPYFTPRETPCYMCEDVPCSAICPSGALDLTKLKDKKLKVNINKSKMGLAIVHDKTCIAYWGIQCDACYRACPLLDEAIKLEYKQNDRTKKHAYLLPVVDSDVCTGCGLCEHACVTKKPSIFVLPNKIAKGAVGNHYVKGWDKEDMKRVQNAKSEIYKTPKSNLNAQDYLNLDIELQ
jgi:ferredoxin-type protein NapG